MKFIRLCIFIYLCLPLAILADTYPTKPIKLIVPWAPGGATDQIGRMLGQALGKSMGTTVIVDNRAGAGGTIGTQAFVKEKPDGYTLLLATSSTNAAGPHLYSKLGFDPINDFTHVVLICSIPNVMVVPTKSSWFTLKDIIADSLKHPGQYSYGSAGVGGSQHLAGAEFKTVTHIDINHVPYKGSGPAAQDLIAGHLDMMIDTGSLGSIKAGLLRPIAVASDRRLIALPNTPTFKESGVNMTASAWYGLMLPAKTPLEIVEKLNNEINSILQKQEIKLKFEEMGAEIIGGTSSEFSKFARTEIVRYEKIVRESGAPSE
jgi:tripartite-type tricarboxylate transporter receptor subunit TctC